MSTLCGDIRVQSRKSSEIGPILDVFFALPNSTGRAFQKLNSRYHPCIATRRLKKFRKDISTSPAVIGVHTLNFMPNFKILPLKFWGCALASLGQSLAGVKIWGRSTPKGPKYSLPKSAFSGSFLTTNSLQLVDQSSPDLFHRTQEELFSINFLSDFGYLEPFQRDSRSKSEVV